MTTVQIPAPQHGHGHSHSKSSLHLHSHPVHALRNTPERRGSADTARGIPIHPVALDGVISASPISTPKIGSAGAEEVEIFAPADDQSGSDSSDDVYVDGEKEGRGRGRGSSNASSISEDSEEDDDDEDFKRRTALGAGVEKISRHKEKSASTSTIHGFAPQATHVPSPLTTPGGEEAKQMGVGVGVDDR